MKEIKCPRCDTVYTSTDTALKHRQYVCALCRNKAQRARDRANRMRDRERRAQERERVKLERERVKLERFLSRRVRTCTLASWEAGENRDNMEQTVRRPAPVGLLSSRGGS